MNTKEIFGVALGIMPPSAWEVVEVKYVEGEASSAKLEIRLDFKKGTKFPCPVCGEQCEVHDTVEKRWRHMNFFQYECELVARVPRTKCEKDGVRQAEVAWSRAGSGFTLMFEAVMILLCRQMSVEKAAEMLGEHDTRIWRALTELVEKAEGARDMSGVRKILVDETSSRRGHRYVTTVVDADSGQLLFMGEGKDGRCIVEFIEKFKAQGGDPEKIEPVGMDMSRSFVKAVKEHLPGARIVFDKFHVVAQACQALDEVRKSLHREGAEGLKKSRWAILGNEETRSPEQLERRRQLSNLYPKLGRALGLKEYLQDALNDRSEELLKGWYQWAWRSKIEAFVKLARTVKKQWDGIVAAIETGITSGLIEAINGKIQLAKRIARGYKNFTYFRAIAYLKCSLLHFHLPNPLPT